MKPFDLEAAKRGEPIMCRNGTPVKFIAFVPEADVCNKVVVLRAGVVVTYSANGEGAAYNTHLVMAPKKRTIWINAYWSGATVFSFGTQEEADKAATKDRLGGKAWPLEIEE